MQSYILVDGWKAKLRFSAAHLIPECDKCGHLHGHTYAVHVKIHGKPDQNGIILDFSILKNVVNNVIKQLDHRVLIPEKNNQVAIQKQSKKVVMGNKKQYQLPLEDCTVLPLESTTAETLADYIMQKIIEKITFPARITMIEVGVDEGIGQGAWAAKKITG